LLCCYCATMKDSVLLGLGTGAIVGGVVGSLDKENPDGAWRGAAIYGAVGALSSYLIHKGLEDRDSKVRKDTLFNLERYSVTRPTGQGLNYNYSISAPNVDTECFETQVRSGKLIQAHCESTIVGQPEWVEGPTKHQTKKVNSNGN